MLTYTFEERGEKPYYQYLYEVLKEDIEEGRLKEGEHLPSKRAFAKQLGLSVMTIASAYEQLLVEGYIYAEKGLLCGGGAALSDRTFTRGSCGENFY